MVSLTPVSIGTVINNRTHILMLVVAVLVILLLLCLSGCASKQSKYQVRYVKGCVIELAVVTADSAHKIMKGVDMTDCEMDAGTEDDE
jgi:hypothetical protein